jgi:hypothetical protein
MNRTTIESRIEKQYDATKTPALFDSPYRRGFDDYACNGESEANPFQPGSIAFQEYALGNGDARKAANS